jgi:hypothetical protein
MEKLKNDDLKSQLWQSARAQGEVCEMYKRETKKKSNLSQLCTNFRELILKV